MKVLKITFNAQTGEETKEEVDVPDTIVTPSQPLQLQKIDLNNLAALIEFAKKMGWVK